MSTLKVFDRTIGLLEKVLDLRVKNQGIISSNIANAETPGYTPARLDFSASLKSALSSREDGRIKLVRTENPVAVGDKNGVKLDEEMVAMAENQILYEAATQMINKKLGLLKYVAQDGR